MATWFKRRWPPVTAATLLIGTLAATAALGLGSQRTVVPYPAGGQMVYGVRPTAVGVPDVGQRGTVGVTELAASLRSYHDSGLYEKDLSAVDRAAQSYIDQRAGSRNGPRSARLAIVLDIDETSISNYADLSAADFASSSLVSSAVLGHGTAIQPTLRLYKDAVAHRVAVFFVTGRPAAIDSISQSNLRRVGYDKGWAGLYEKPPGAGTERFKSSTRAAIEQRGYDIIANIGDQQSDLDGGHADRAFKLPNPFYFISD